MTFIKLRLYNLPNKTRRCFHMKHKAFLLFVTMVLVLACVGCGQQTQKESANQGLTAPLPVNGQDTGNNESQSGTDENPAYGNNETQPNAPSLPLASQSQLNFFLILQGFPCFFCVFMI